MAGAGFKSWVDGDILTASDVNTYLMQQAVMVFADASARTSGIAAPSEGMVTYLTGTDVIEYYDGAAWQPILDQDVIEAKGDLIVGTADDAVGRLAVGADGLYLKADSGQATGLAWSSIPTGKILQVVQATYSTATSSTSTSLVDTGLSATITPTSATSKVLVMSNQSFVVLKTSADTTGGGFKLLRGSTSIYDSSNSNNSGIYLQAVGATTVILVARSSLIYLDSPATTSATTYKTQMVTETAGHTITAQAGNSDSSMILIEVGA